MGTCSLAVRPAAPAATQNPAFMQSEAVDGAVVLSGDCALVGMEFIGRLDKYLIVGKAFVALMDEIDLDALGIV